MCLEIQVGIVYHSYTLDNRITLITEKDIVICTLFAKSCFMVLNIRFHDFRFY